MKKQLSLVFFTWLGVCLLGALPFYYSGFFANFTDAVFESVSGFTTTGATVLRDIDTLPGWLLFWRSIIQWIGGMGILFTIAKFPFFSKGGFQSRKTENIIILLSVYIALTALQFILLFIFGMNWFDALTHSFSTMSTGGFSVRVSSIAYYNSPAIEWVCVFFMFLAGVNLSFIWRIFNGRAESVMRNSEARTYTGIVFLAAVVIAIATFPQTPSFSTALRQAFFQVTSIISTTGFYSANFNTWAYVAQGVLFLLLFIGGCSGSTAGGVKVIRYVILSKQTVNEMKHLVYPRGVFDFKLDGKDGSKKTVYGAIGFLFLYFLIVFLASLLVGSSGADVFTSFNTALICQGNIGLGMGEVGAFMPFPDFPVYVKWGLCLVMLMGRLELWIVFALFTKEFWRR